MLSKYLDKQAKNSYLQRMDFEQTIKTFGSQANLARAMGVSTAAVAQWRKNGIPLGRQYQIQALTDGGLRVPPRPVMEAA